MADLPAAAVIAAVLAGVAMALFALSRRAARGCGVPVSIRQGLVAAPALAYGFWAATLILGLLLDPARHNLWPLEMGFVVVMWLVWVAAVAVIASILRRANRAS